MWKLAKNISIIHIPRVHIKKKRTIRIESRLKNINQEKKILKLRKHLTQQIEGGHRILIKMDSDLIILWHFDINFLDLKLKKDFYGT